MALSKRSAAIREWWAAGGFLELVRRLTGRRGVLEHTFALPRRWRFDAAWPEVRVALEIDGGTWGVAGSKPCPLCGNRRLGRHSAGAGAHVDREKGNAAAIRGWLVLHATWREVETGAILGDVVATIRARMKEEAAAAPTATAASRPENPQESSECQA